MKINLKNIPTKVIPLDQIVFDERNPNRMTEDQMRALNKVVDKYGFAQDPWVNQIKGGKYMVVDGEHRILLLREKGVKKIACKIFKLKYSDVRILRQVANKLRGQHDKAADAAEYKEIYDSGDLSEFAEMLSTEEDDFKRILEKSYDMDFGLEEPEMPEPPKNPKSKPGDIYLLGKWTYCPKCKKRHDL